MKLRQVVPFGFMTIVTVMIANGLFSKLTVNSLTSTVDDVLQSYQVQTALQDLEQVLVDVQLGERGFIITRNEAFLQPYLQAKSDLADQFEETRLLLQDDPDQTQRLRELEQLTNKGITVLSANIERIRAGQRPSSTELLRGKEVLEEIRSKVQEMLQAESEVLATKQRTVNQAETFSTVIALGGTLLGTLVGLLIILFVVRNVVRPINEVTAVITSSSTEIAATVTQQEHVATEQASSVQETTTIMEQLGASSVQSAEQAKIAASGAQDVSVLAFSGTEAVNHTLEDMETLKEKVEIIAQQIVHLREQTVQIGTISALVSDLANQTNMLALNAAVEAVRAGEYGKGFAVVATEIRKLADQSKNSAEKINLLVHDIQTAIHSTVMVTDEGINKVDKSLQTAEGMAATFKNVTDAINGIVINNQQISLIAQQQATAIQQVVTAMDNLNQGAIQTASGIRQTKVGTQRLNEAALNLQTVV